MNNKIDVMIQIPEKYRAHLESMNRHNRRKWIKQNRKLLLAETQLAAVPREVVLPESV